MQSNAPKVLCYQTCDVCEIKVSKVSKKLCQIIQSKSIEERPQKRKQANTKWGKNHLPEQKEAKVSQLLQQAQN